MFGILATRQILTQRTMLTLQRGMASAATAGRVAVVTGAARGIGRAIALRLAKDGLDVAINDIPSAEPQLQEVSALIAQAGKRAFISTGDVSLEADVKRLVKSTAENLGSVDVMVANAGICILNPISKVSVEEWDKLFGVNARGVFLCYKYAAEQMLKQGRGGRIIGAASIAGKKGFPPFGAYSATKFAIRGFTQSTAQELAPHGITVNAYAPGIIETDMVTAMNHPTTSDATTFDVDKWTTPVGFNGKPEDVAGLVSYLASAESRFITGQSIVIDGGIFFD